VSAAAGLDSAGPRDRLLFTATAVVVVAAVVALVRLTDAPSFRVYMNVLEGSQLLYLLPLAAVAGIITLIRFPRLPVFALAFLLPFNFVGGYWGSETVVLAAKILVNVIGAAAVLATFFAAPEDRAWLSRTALGRAVVYWLIFDVAAVAIGFLSTPNRGDWIRESNWLLFYLFVLPVGTLIRGRGHIRQLIVWAAAGVAGLQLYAFWVLTTGQRYARADAWEGGDTFIRTPYSSECLFILFLAVAALLSHAAANAMRTLHRWAIAAVIALLGGGLLASMGRSLWLSGALGLLVVFALSPWNRRTANAALAVTAGIALAILLVVAFDRLSPSSSGRWTSNAISFLMDLGSSQSTSRVTREMEWATAVQSWLRSPLVGVGYGYPYPVVLYGALPAQQLADPFYTHNSFLNVLAKCGAFGFAAFVYLIGRAATTATRLCRRSDDAADRAFLIGVIAAIVQVAALSLVMPSMTTTDSVMYCGMLIGLVVAAERVAGRADA
jgi:O-antigen ligase